MRPLSTFLLLSILAFAGACSKSNYAQVEPDDLYFTHKDRKASQTNYSTSVGSSITPTEDSYSSAGADVSAYTSQHSPTLQSGTIQSTTLGSPTIQQYEEPFYDASQNPDYLYGQEAESAEEISDAYYMKDYASYNTANTEAVTVPQTVNNYYGYDGFGYNPYYSNSYSRWGNSYSSYYNSPFSISIGFGLSPYGYGYNPYGYGYGYGYNPYRRYSYASYYGYGYYDNYYSSYPYFYSSNSFCYAPTYSGNSNYTNVDNTNTTQVVNGPRKSRSSVSYYVNKQNYDTKRRDDYLPGNEGGRVIVNQSGNINNATDGSSNGINVDRRNSRTNSVANRRGSVTPSSGTIQRNSNTVSRYRTNTRSSGTINNNSATQRQSRTYVNQSGDSRTRNVNRSSNRPAVSNNGNRTTGTRYTSPSRSNSNSSYKRTRTSSSYQSPRTNSSRKSSYTPSRSSSSNRSSYSPSRSSSSSKSTRSYSAPKSSPSRSTGTRSSGSRSASSTSKRKQ